MSVKWLIRSGSGPGPDATVMQKEKWPDGSPVFMSDWSDQGAHKFSSREEAENHIKENNMKWCFAQEDFS